jgi:hypothetical protein
VGILREYFCTFMIISYWILLRMRNVSDKSCREKSKHTFYVQYIFSPKLCHLWYNMKRYGRGRQATDDNITWHMHFIWQVTKDTDTHSEYVILNAFPQQQWLHERASLLSYMYIACLVLNCDIFLQKQCALFGVFYLNDWHSTFLEYVLPSEGCISWVQNPLLISHVGIVDYHYIWWFSEQSCGTLTLINWWTVWTTYILCRNYACMPCWCILLLPHKQAIRILFHHGIVAVPCCCSLLGRLGYLMDKF